MLISVRKWHCTNYGKQPTFLFLKCYYERFRVVFFFLLNLADSPANENSYIPEKLELKLQIIVEILVSTLCRNVFLRKSKRKKKIYAETLLLCGFYCPYTSFQHVYNGSSCQQVLQCICCTKQNITLHGTKNQTKANQKPRHPMYLLEACRWYK